MISRSKMRNVDKSVIPKEEPQEQMQEEMEVTVLGSSGSRCKRIPVNELVISKDTATPPNQRFASPNSPRNVKLFRKNHNTSNGNIPRAAFSIIIGGSDLVPHTKRSRVNPADISGEHLLTDSASLFFTDNTSSSRNGHDASTGRPSSANAASPRRSPTKRNRLWNEARRANDSDGGGNGNDLTGNELVDNGRNERGSRSSRPRRNIVSKF